MKYKNYFKILIIILICILAIGTASAAEDANDADVISDSSDTIDEVISVVNEDQTLSGDADDEMGQANDEENLGVVPESYDDFIKLIHQNGKTIDLNQNITLQNNTDKSVYVYSNNVIDGHGFSIDGNNSRGFYLYQTNNVTFKNIHFVNFNAYLSGGAIYGHMAKDFNVINCTFDNCKAREGGNAISASYQCTGSIINSTFNGFENENSYNYGDVVIRGNDYIVDNCTFTNSYTRKEGGAIYIGGNNNTVRNSRFNGTLSGGWSYYSSGPHGGAICIKGNGNKVLNSNFTNFRCSEYGGAIYVQGDNTVVDNCNFTFDNPLVEDNVRTLPEEGGAIYIEGQNSTISCSNFLNLNVDDGRSLPGSIIYATGETRISNSTFENNIAGVKLLGDNNLIRNCIFKDNYRGSVEISNGNVINCNFTNNTGSYAGGALCVDYDSSIIDCNFQKNSAQYGGAVFANENNKIINCNFTDNTVTSHLELSNQFEKLNYAAGGGAIALYGRDNTVTNATFTNNAAESLILNPKGIVKFTKEEINETHYKINVFCDMEFLSSFMVYGNLEESAYGKQSMETWYDASFALSDDETYSYMYSCMVKDRYLILPENETITYVNQTFICPVGNFEGVYAKFVTFDGTEYEDVSETAALSSAYGGAIMSFDSNNITNSKFSGNSAFSSGGSIHFVSGNSNILNCSFDDSDAKLGSVLYLTDTISTYRVEFIHEMEYIPTDFVGECNVEIKDSNLTVTHNGGCQVQISMDDYSRDVIIQFTPQNNHVSGIYLNNSTVNFNNVRSTVDGETTVLNGNYAVNYFVNQNISVETYGADGQLTANETHLTDEEGKVVLKFSDVFSPESPVKFIRAYHLSDSQFNYAEDEYFVDLPDFELLQAYVNSVEENGTLVLDRNYTYDLDRDTIWEGIVVDKNITIDGRGFAIDALHISRIFNVLGQNTKFVNLTFKNAYDGAIYYNNVTNAVVEDSKFIDNIQDNGTIEFYGENLTISNVEMINSTARFEFYLPGLQSSWVSCIYANATGDIKISKSNFTDSKFYSSAIGISNARNVTFEGLFFEDDWARWRYDTYTSYYNGDEWVTDFTFDEFCGYDNNGNHALLDITAQNFQLLNSKATNTTVKTFLISKSVNATIKNLNVSDSNISEILTLKCNSSLEIDGVNVENVSSTFSEIVSKYNEYVLKSQNITTTLLKSAIINSKASNSVISNVNVKDIVSELFSLIYLESQNKVSLNNISVNDVDSNYTDDVIYIQTSAKNVTIDSVEIRNINVDSYYERVDNDEVDYTKNITMPLSAIVIAGGDVITLSGVVVENVLIDKVIEGNFASADISDVKVTDSSMPSGSEYLFKIIASSDVSFENVLVDNISIVPVKIYERNLTHQRYWTEHKNLNEEKLFNANPGVNIISNKGKINLNNINITNSNSNAMEGLFNVYSFGDIVANNIIVQNITEKTKFIVSDFINSSYQQENNSVLSGIGSDNSIMFYSSDGNVNITALYVSDVVSDSIRSVVYENFTHDNLDSSVTCCSYFLYVQGNNVTANGLTVNNAVIGGYDDNAVFVAANDNLNVDDFTLSNVTSNPVYLKINYWGTYDSEYYQKYYLPLATASVVMSAPEANISNINLYNVSGQSGHGLLCLNMDNLNLTNVSVSNIESNDAYFVDYDKNLRKNVTNSVTADHGMGYSTEINVECSMNANLKGINISSLNVFGQGYWDYLMSVSGNNISVEDVNVEHVHEKELRTTYYYDKPDSQLYDCSIGNYAPSILIKGQDVRFINLTASDVDSSGAKSFVQIEGVNVTFENASVIDSKLLTGDYGLIKIEADDIEFNNVLINNITGVTPHNYTYHKDYYDESGNYAFTGTYYDYQSASGDVGVGIYLEGYYSINMTNVNITNSCGGDMPLIGAGYSSGNIYFNNILIENISSFYYESITFKEKQQKYVTDASFSETRVFELSSGSNLTIYNIKVINIDKTTGEGVAEIDGGNVIMENVTFINWDSEPGVGNLIYDPVTGEYVYEYLEYHDCEEFMYIMAEDGDVNMTNVVMDRIPAPYDSSYIGATRVNIVNSTFKNMYCTITYYRYNLTTHKYDLTDSTNEGVIFEIETEDYLRIVNSTVENISTSKYALGIDSNNVSFINTTFKDIHAELLDHDDYYHEYSDVTHGNSFEIKRNSNGVLILDSRFINCTADYGGALYIDGTVIYYITNTTFESNKAIQGGAIYINGSGVGSIIFNTTFIENLASNNGGAIYILETAEDNATLINQSTFIGNHADHDGGAFFYNDTQAKFFFCDYEWFNRTAMFSDGKLNLNTKTRISDSLFENNTDYALNITVKDIDEFKNQTVIICIDVNATGEVSVNVTDENGQFISDINGNILKDKNFTLVNGKVVIELGKLAIGKYNISAYYNNYNSQYDLYHDYAYHLNSTVFGVHKHIFNVDANDTIFVDENVTVTVELNKLSTGTVNITISNETDTFTFTDIPIVNGTANISVGEFLAGKYNVSVTYAGDEIFSADSNQTSFEVIQRQSYVNVTVEDVEYKNNAVVIVKVPLDQKGNVTIKINNVEYTKEITNGQVEFVIENLTVQKWEVNVTFAENRVYKSSNNRTEFNVLPIDLNANVTAQNITVLDNPTFAIEVPQDFKGNVSITVDGKTYKGTVKDIVELEKLLAGDKTAVVEFYGDENYKKLTLEIPFEVERTSSVVEVKVDDVTYPETAVALINVSGMANGTVEIKIGNKTFTGTVSNGVAKVNLTGLNAGVKEVSVRFITNDDYNADGSNTTSFTVFKVESFVIISNDGDDIVVTLPQNATGEVVIYIDGKAYPVSAEDHKAILKDILKIGNNSVVAAYAGDNNYLDSINVTNLVLNKLKSSINASAESVTYGEDVIVTVNVPSIQTGSVTITVDGKNYTSEIKDGKSEFTISGLSADNYEVKVYYSGDDVYEASQNVTSFTINKKDLGAEVVALNITVEDNAKFFINVPDDFDGKVKITVGGETYDDVVKFMVEMGKLSEGNKTAKVTIYGDNNYNNETLDVKFTVSPVETPKESAPMNVTVDTDGDKATVKVDLPEDATGVVLIDVDGVGYYANITNGSAVLEIDGLETGNHTADVTYPGDDKYDASQNVTSFSVNKKDLDAEVVALNITVEDNAKFFINVPDDFNGKVKITVDGETYDDVVKFTVEMGKLSEGNKTAKVTFYGDDKYNDESLDVNFTVSNVTSPEPAPVYHETNVTVVNVTSDSAVAVVEVADNANGTVNVTVDGKTYPAEVVNGTAVVPLDNLTPGNHSVVADFEGDDGSKSSAATNVDIPKENAPVNVTVDTDGDKVTVKVDVPDDATGVVLVDVDGVGYYANITNGSAVLEIDGVEPGNHTAKVTYPGDDKYGKTSTSTDFNVTESKKPIATVLVVDSTFTRYATDYYAGERGAMFYGTLMDTDGNVLANKTVQIAVNGPIYNVTTDKDGKAGLMVNLMNANIYTYALFFSGDETYNASHIASSKLTVVKKTTSIKASNKAFAKSTKTKVVEATLKTMKNPFNGKTYLKTGKKVTLKVNGKTYKAKINSKGIAKFKVKLTKKGKYTAKISFAGDRTYEAASKNIVITIK